MEDLVNIFVKSVFVDNMIFAYFLGMCSYLAVSKTVKTAVGLGAAVIFVLGITVPINYLLEKNGGGDPHSQRRVPRERVLREDG